MRAKQLEIIRALNVKPTIEPTDEIRQIIQFLKDYLKAHSFLKTFVLGISGGQDSTLLGRLLQLTMEEMRDESGDSSYQFIAVRLPYGVQNDEADAQLALNFIQPDQVMTVNIKAGVDAIVDSLIPMKKTISDFNKGNIKARIRMVTQYAIAGEHQGIVVGSDHAAEAVTGFYTKFGDGAADIVPLWGLNKRQGRQLLQVLGADPRLYEKIPTADLEENRPLLADEEALGVSYSLIDDYLEGRIVPEQAAQTIENWYNKTEHKRHLPINRYDSFWQSNS
ncbi:ammonia-dependent NAD(+) synthetase [Atopobacter phocae]|uniref:ammonia-dependent NAD(+) synthetase n=1 Tax=Atopobacter phocae TaxID=136492 RepID=UPI0004712D48|nr:ammonia-dependent NAD(+) synthetase [Atopobacter phocae]